MNRIAFVLSMITIALIRIVTNVSSHKKTRAEIHEDQIRAPLRTVAFSQSTSQNCFSMYMPRAWIHGHAIGHSPDTSQIPRSDVMHSRTASDESAGIAATLCRLCGYPDRRFQFVMS